jgi:hypothetical protein
LEDLKRVPRKDASLTFDEYRPVAAACDFSPFLRLGANGQDHSGFIYTVCQRLFSLANKPLEIKRVGALQDAFDFIADYSKPHNIVLSVAETITRSIRLYTFHTPATVPLNAVVPLNGLKKNSTPIGTINRVELKRISDEFIHQRHTEGSTPFMAVREELGHRYLLEVLGIPKSDLEPFDYFSPASIAGKLRDDEGSPCGPRVFVADELTCLHVARELNSEKCRALGNGVQYGMLFPLGTLAVAHCEDFTKIPTYKIGLFSIARQLERIIAVLESALKTLFNNERYFVAIAYQNLATTLTTEIEDCIVKLPPNARECLYESHLYAKEHFQFKCQTLEFAKALAARVVRQTLRLNTQLMESEDDLNLPWRPILERVKEVLGPLRPEYRDLRFDQGSVRSRVFPPFIDNKPSADASKSTEGGKAAPARICKWSIFGPVLSEVADILNFEALKITSETDETHRAFDFTIGMLDVPRRTLDLHFFRFPVRFKMNAIYLPSHLPALAISDVVELRSLLSAGDSPSRRRPASPGVLPIVLAYTGAHYLCWERGCPGIDFIDYDPGKHAFETQLDQFENKLFQWSRKYETGKTPIPLIVADELTCLRLLPQIRANVKDEAELLFPELMSEQDSRTDFYYSIAVQRTESDKWWQITQEVFPCAISKSHRNLVREIRALEEELVGIIASSRRPNVRRNEYACEDVAWARNILCANLVERARNMWNGSLLHEAWLPVLAEAFDRKA